MPDEQNYENWYIRCQMACRAPFWPLYIHQNAPPLLRAMIAIPLRAGPYCICKSVFKFVKVLSTSNEKLSSPNAQE